MKQGIVYNQNGKRQEVIKRGKQEMRELIFLLVIGKTITISRK